MTKTSEPTPVEQWVGVPRHPWAHIGRPMSDNTLLVLHSQQCFDSGKPFVDCPFTDAAHQGRWDRDVWGVHNGPHFLTLDEGWLFPGHQPEGI